MDDSDSFSLIINNYIEIYEKENNLNFVCNKKYRKMGLIVLYCKFYFMQSESI